MVRFGDGFDYKTGEQLGYPQEWLDSVGAEVDPKRESGLWTLGTTQRTCLAYWAPVTTLNSRICAMYCLHMQRGNKWRLRPPSSLRGYERERSCVRGVIVL